MGKNIEEIKRLYNLGVGLVHHQLKADWFKSVTKSVEGKFKGKDIMVAASIMKELDGNTNCNKAYELALREHKMSEECFESANVLVAQYSRRGIEFFLWVASCKDSRVLTVNEEKFISKIVRRNESLSREKTGEEKSI